ncbi:MAG: FecCD family ABC transporter permease [Coriobacteriales bacterium]|jgi:iron complex transport system permease protein
MTVDVNTQSSADLRRGRIATVFVVLAILVVVLCVVNLVVGTTQVSLEQIWSILTGADTESAQYDIIWSVRMPRTIACLVLGGALALAGFLLQTFFNNPIAGPYILGISSGAKLIVAMVMIFAAGAAWASNSWVLIIAAFLGAMLSMGLVLIMSSKTSSPAMLIVIGVMIGYICSAVTEFAITFADDQSIVNLHNWSVGSFSGVSWTNIVVMTIVVVVTSIAVFMMSKPIGAFQMGEAYAQSMGVNIKVFKVALILLSSLLAATVTAFAGPISFVGIAVPHVVKGMLKTSRPLVVTPACFLGGSIFCLGCDLIARMLFAPVELSISAVTAVFGAPIVISVMLRRKK